VPHLREMGNNGNKQNNGNSSRSSSRVACSCCLENLLLSDIALKWRY